MSHNPQNVTIVDDVPVSGLDMALPATILFLLLYYPLALLFGVREHPLSGTLFLLLAFAALFAALWGVKFLMARGNMPLPHALRLLNSNVGLQTTNGLVVCLAIAAAVTAWLTLNGWLSAAAIAIAIGFTVNMNVGPRYWALDEMGRGWTPTNNPNFTPATPAIPQGKKEVRRTFDWAPVLKDKGITTQGDDTFEVTFVEADYKDETSAGYVRKDNPFSQGQPASDAEYTAFAAGVKPGHQNDAFEAAALSQVIMSAQGLCAKYNLPDYEMYDLLLRFCQQDIRYVTDDKSEPIHCTPEYFRFPGETLFDTEGDCDCKSVLAYNLFSLLGAQAELVTVCINGDDNPQHHLNHAALLLRDGSVPLPPHYPRDTFGPDAAPMQGVFCDATAEGYAPGRYSPDMEKKSVTLI